MNEISRTPGDGFCALQANCGIQERCSTDCLYFEASGRPTIGCLLKDADIAAIPHAVARQLLKTAGRRSR